MTEGQILRHEEERLLRENVQHLHGPEEVSYGEDELMVVCLVRDGRPYIKSFVEHYRSLGVRHIAFLDNASEDGTVEALREYDNVTVLRTELPYKAPGGTVGNSWTREVLFKQYLVSRFGQKNRWCLCADIDELFDYPYSDVVSLGSLLGYLRSKSYTALATQMLDMFPEEPLSGRAESIDEPLKELHRFYGISSVDKVRMKGTEYLRTRDTTLESEEVESFRGGIRDTLFGTFPYLTKVPLVFLDGKMRSMDDSSHRVGNATIADLTGVLFHYKFVDEHFHGQVAQAVREEHRIMNSAKYKMYKEVLDRSPSLRVKLETARELEGVNDLLDDQFLVVSEGYLDWVAVEENKGVLGATRSEPDNLIEALLESRRQERVKTLKVQKLERRLRENERLARLESKRRERAHDRKTQRLEQRLREKAGGQPEENRRLSQRVRNLERQIEGVRGSRAWRLMEALHRIKTRASSLGKRSS
jgi:hypothetical protein